MFETLCRPSPPPALLFARSDFPAGSRPERAGIASAANAPVRGETRARRPAPGQRAWGWRGGHAHPRERVAGRNKNEKKTYPRPLFCLAQPTRVPRAGRLRRSIEGPAPLFFHNTYPRPSRRADTCAIAPHAKGTGSSWDLVGGAGMPDRRDPSAGPPDCLPAARRAFGRRARFNLRLNGCAGGMVASAVRTRDPPSLNVGHCALRRLPERELQGANVTTHRAGRRKPHPKTQRKNEANAAPSLL